MKCEYDYCIYNQKCKCILEVIQINELGMCDSCIALTLDKAYMKKIKKKQLSDIIKREVQF